jgi:hypothetical protein
VWDVNQYNVIVANFWSVGEDFNFRVIEKGPEVYTFKRNLKKLPVKYLNDLPLLSRGNKAFKFPILANRTT